MIPWGDFSGGSFGWNPSPGWTFANGKALYSNNINGKLWSVTKGLPRVPYNYRWRLDIDAINDCHIFGYIKPFSGIIAGADHNAPGLAIDILKSELDGITEVGLEIHLDGPIGTATIDNFLLDRLGELPALVYNFLPDDKAQFDITDAALDRKCIHHGSYQIPSNILTLYDSTLET